MDASQGFGLFDGGATTLSLLVFLAAGTFAFALMIGVRARSAVRRRAATVGPGEDVAGRHSLRHSGLAAMRKLVDYTTKHYVSADSKDAKLLRRRLLQAGIITRTPPHISSSPAEGSPWGLRSPRCSFFRSMA